MHAEYGLNKYEVDNMYKDEIDNMLLTIQLIKETTEIKRGMNNG